jgi:hypothetical protein
VSDATIKLIIRLYIIEFILKYNYFFLVIIIQIIYYDIKRSEKKKYFIIVTIQPVASNMSKNINLLTI